jgi:hypothetical protein
MAAHRQWRRLNQPHSGRLHRFLADGQKRLLEGGQGNCHQKALNLLVKYGEPLGAGRLARVDTCHAGVPATKSCRTSILTFEAGDGMIAPVLNHGTARDLSSSLPDGAGCQCQPHLAMPYVIHSKNGTGGATQESKAENTRDKTMAKEG